MKERENWVDHVKVTACFFVAAGHMFQGLIQAGILENLPVLEWFNQTIYYFHVQLFFICSGFLYQKYSVVNCFQSWKNNLLKKILALGIPYFVFSFITWGLKKAFAGSVNNEVNSLWFDLFVIPQSPYWYLFTLFFVFFITPTFRSRKMCAFGMIVALLIQFTPDSRIYAFSQTAKFEIWFVLGMAVCMMNFSSIVQKWGGWCGILCIALFVVLSIIISLYNVINHILNIVMGLLACFGVLLLAMRFGEKRNKLAVYTMPVFLLHTIFSAGFRTVLIKIGITDSAVHIAVGLVASFLCPAIAAVIMERIKWDFLFYPSKYIRNNR